MPNKDGTGPLGEGPKTGRQMGNCKDAEPQPGFGPRRGLGRGLGRGQGRGGCLGRGFRRRVIQEDN